MTQRLVKERKKWLAVARDEQLAGSHILIVEADSIKTAYEACAHQCIMHGLRMPEQRAIYELNEESVHVCTVLDPQFKGGLFNGRANVSIGPKSADAEPWSGAIRR